MNNCATFYMGTLPRKRFVQHGESLRGASKMMKLAFVTSMVACAIVLLAASSAFAKSVALVIGNFSYEVSPLN